MIVAFLFWLNKNETNINFKSQKYLSILQQQQMSILDTFQKNYDKLKSEYIEYKEYHDTMSETVPIMLELLDNLFLEENIKVLPNYSELVDDYLDEIKQMLATENYKQLKLEHTLPNVYDAPRTRKDKAARVTKLKNKKVTDTPNARAVA